MKNSTINIFASLVKGVTNKRKELAPPGEYLFLLEQTSFPIGPLVQECKQEITRMTTVEMEEKYMHALPLNNITINPISLPQDKTPWQIYSPASGLPWQPDF